MIHMKNLVFLACLILMQVGHIHAQYTFTQTYGGERDERAMSVIQTKSGDYVLAGATSSFGNGKTDVLVVRVDEQGNELWKKHLGGTHFDWANSITETRAGNFIVAGYSQDEKTKTQNAWVFLLDQSGRGIWSHKYGGEKADEAKTVIQTSDGGFAVAGFSHSYGKGKSDVWLLRLNASGEEIWQKTYGGSEIERAYAIQETDEGDFIMAGFTQSFGNGKADILVLKVNKNGKGIWKKNYGGKENEAVESLAITQDGDIMLAGWSASGSQGELEGIIMRLDKKGNPRWKKSYGQAGNDSFHAIKKIDDGFALVGTTSNTGDDAAQIWLMKIDKEGEMIWQKRSSGEEHDYGYGLALASDRGFVVAGSTNSYSKGGSDMLLIKTDEYGNFYTQPEPSISTELIADNTKAADLSEEESNFYKPNLYILSIGVSEYQDSNINLTFAHKDASAVADRFSTLEGSLFNKVEMKKLTNEDASLFNIKTGISWLEQQATQKDVILIFISSHGALDHKGNLYILPNDFNAYNLFATALNIRDITEGTNGVPCKKLVFLDACHSGQSGNDLLEFGNAKAVNVNKVVEELMSKQPGVTVMTSSSGKEYSYENPNWGHGAFTKAILEGLDGQADINQNQVITLMELEYFVGERVKELTGGRQHPYTPIKLSGNIPLYILEE